MEGGEREGGLNEPGAKRRCESRMEGVLSPSHRRAVDSEYPCDLFWRPRVAGRRRRALGPLAQTLAAVWLCLLLLPRGGGSALLEKHVSISSGAFCRTEASSSSLQTQTSSRSVPSIQPEGTTSSLVMGRSSGPTILDESGRRRLKELEGEISSLKEDLEDAKAAQERANRAMRSKDMDTRSMKDELEKERKNHQRTRNIAEDLARTVGQIKGTIQERAAEMAQMQIQSAKVTPHPIFQRVPPT